MRFVFSIVCLVFALLIQSVLVSASETPASEQSAVDFHHQHDLHDAESHDANDHKHPFGDDSLHELMCHGFMNTADLSEHAAAVMIIGKQVRAPISFVRLSGRTIQPPVPPPLA